MHCGTFIKLLLASFLPIVFTKDLCEYIHIPKRNISMVCCVNNTMSEMSFREFHEIKRVETVFLGMNGSFYICESGTNLYNRNAVGKRDDDSIIFPDTSRNKVETTKIPMLGNKNFGDVPLRCPEGTTLDSDGICVESWD
ncbi:hypothetical protein HHI36_016319 [Cryptolaemus montrouzieri]|uniref:Uncharacterized protein n=1 Tax=Cryptolaemus montrouzieri TaxID=559131 RepID=A0ABD2NJD0_9CUCU